MDYNKLKNVKILPSNSKDGFSLLAGINRPISPSHVTKLVSSIDMMGIIRPVIVADIDFISGIGETYIIDGQHLYHACIRKGIGIPYIKIDVKDKYDMVKELAYLNNTSKSWGTQDYIRAWTAVEKDYVTLNKYFTTYDISISQLAEILMNNECTRSGGAGTLSVMLKKGEFRVGDEDRAVEILDRITDMLKILPRMNRIDNRLLISSYVSFMLAKQDYDHADYMKKLAKNKSKFLLATQDPDAFKNLLAAIA